VSAGRNNCERAPNHRSYQLEIELQRAVRCRIGRLGIFVFPKGRYVYTGSARRNVAARIARHLAKAKRRHWHIDYLLARPEARVRRALSFAAGECDVNRRTRGTIAVPGFGSSDCRAGCGAHLKFQACNR